MCHCWLDEEARLGYSRNDGILTNLFTPLKSHDWPTGAASQVPPSLLDSDSSVTSGKPAGAMSSSLKLHSPLAQSKIEPGNVPREVRTHVMQADSRTVLAQILGLLQLLDCDVCFSSPTDITSESKEGDSGMSTELGLNPQDKQVLSIAKRYEIIQNGEFWREVNDEISAKSIFPIDSDQAMLQYHLKESFNAATFIQLEHFELREIERGVKRSDNNMFISKILDQKNQQIKAEWIKRNSKKKMRSFASG